MKIHGSEEIIKSVDTGKNQRKKISPNMEFGAILKEKIENSAAGKNGIESTTLINKVFPVRLNLEALPEKTSTVDRIENLLDLLDDYRYKLADPQATLKDIHPLIARIEKEKEHLTAALDLLTDRGELKSILNQTLVTASLEVIKFNRGDYITS